MINLDDGEELLAVAKKHWFVYVGLFVRHGLLLIGLLFAFVFFSGVLSRDILIGCMWISTTSFFWFWTEKYFDKWFITNKRIVAIDQLELFDRKESTLLISRIQDVDHSKNGLVEDFLGFGRLQVQTAGEDREFIMNDVANIDEISKAIVEQKIKVVGN